MMRRKWRENYDGSAGGEEAAWSEARARPGDGRLTKSESSEWSVRLKAISASVRRKPDTARNQPPAHGDDVIRHVT